MKALLSLGSTLHALIPAAALAQRPAPAAVTAAPEMPKTATRLPLAGTIGLVLLALGAGLAIVRRRARV